MKKTVLCAVLCCIAFSVFSQTENQNPTLLEFKFHKNDKSRIISTVDENVYLNGMLNHKSVILNREGCA